MFKVDLELLKDANGIFGFRLEQLTKIDIDKVKAKGYKVRKIVERLYAKEYCYGNLNLSNVIVNERREVVLINFTFSGIIR